MFKIHITQNVARQGDRLINALQRLAYLKTQVQRLNIIVYVSNIYDEPF